MLAELYQITSILSNVFVILSISWLVIKYFQINKISSYMMMQTTNQTTNQTTDQIDELLSGVSFQQVEDIQEDFDNTKLKELKEKLILVVASGKSKQFLGKALTTKDIEELDDNQIQKFYARYEAVLGGMITKQLKHHICHAYSRFVSFICPTLNFKIEDIAGLTTSLNDGPFIDLALSSLTCKLYHEYGHLLAPIEAAIITSGYVSSLDASTLDASELQLDTSKLAEDEPSN